MTMATDPQLELQSRTSTPIQSAPRRIAQLFADWTRTLIIIVGCLVALVCAAAVLYVAFQGMFYFIGLVQQALAPARFP